MFEDVCIYIYTYIHTHTNTVAYINNHLRGEVCRLLQFVIVRPVEESTIIVVVLYPKYLNTPDADCAGERVKHIGVPRGGHRYPTQSRWYVQWWMIKWREFGRKLLYISRRNMPEFFRTGREKTIIPPSHFRITNVPVKTATRNIPKTNPNPY